MTRYLAARGIRIFDFTQFAKPLTDSIKAKAEELAVASGLTIDYLRKKNFRKEERIKEVLKKRGTHPGLVWISSALGPCTTYHKAKTGRPGTQAQGTRHHSRPCRLRPALIRKFCQF